MRPLTRVYSVDKIPMLDFHNVHERCLCPADSCWLLITQAEAAEQRFSPHRPPLQLGGIQGEMQARSSNGKKPASYSKSRLGIPLYVPGTMETVAQ